MKDSKEIFKKNLIGFIIGIIAGGSISVIAATYFPSNEVKYDNSVSGLQSTNVQGAIDELYGVCFPPKAGDTILEKVNLEKDPYECRYFFTGKNPNNYITFNGEIAGWRIISVECDGTIKIMKNESIGKMQWDTAYSNNWVRPADLNTYLNDTYYNSLSGTAQKQIIAKDFSIGAVAYDNTNLADIVSNENSKKWNGKIALPTVSEYMRSISDKNNCGTVYQTWNSSVCASTTWMYNSDTWWILTPWTENSYYVFYALSDEPFINVMDTLDVRPVIYISSNIKITDGDGTQSNPYTIS